MLPCCISALASSKKEEREGGEKTSRMERKEKKERKRKKIEGNKSQKRKIFGKILETLFRLHMTTKMI